MKRTKTHVIDKLIRAIGRSHAAIKLDPLLGYPFLKKEFRHRVGYTPNLRNPITFNEKITWRKLYDRDRFLPFVADKYKVREYVRERLKHFEGDILIPLLYETKNPSDIPFNDLPENYIVKANHGSGTNLIQTKRNHTPEEKIVRICKQWLSTSYGIDKHEWCYQNIERRVIIEELILDENGKPPADYKFHMADGECIFLQVDFDRSENHTRTLIGPGEWERIPATFKFSKGRMPRKPDNLETMKKIAQSLSQELPYARVDLYSVNEKVYFGEITNYPGSGMEQFKPVYYDHFFGKKVIL